MKVVAFEKLIRSDLGEKIYKSRVSIGTHTLNFPGFPCKKKKIIKKKKIQKMGNRRKT